MSNGRMRNDAGNEGPSVLELALLAVGQRVHRVDDDRVDLALTAGLALTENMIDDRNDVREALAGAGPGGEDE